MRGSWRTTGLDPAVRRDSARAGVRPRARYEVRICEDSGVWEVRAGLDDTSQVFASRRGAINQARELARRAWVERGLLSCVKALSIEGTWEVVDVFGVAPLRP